MALPDKLADLRSGLQRKIEHESEVIRRASESYQTLFKGKHLTEIRDCHMRLILRKCSEPGQKDNKSVDLSHFAFSNMFDLLNVNLDTLRKEHESLVIEFRERLRETRRLAELRNRVEAVLSISTLVKSLPAGSEVGPGGIYATIRARFFQHMSKETGRIIGSVESEESGSLVFLRPLKELNALYFELMNSHGEGTESEHLPAYLVHELIKEYEGDVLRLLDKLSARLSANLPKGAVSDLCFVPRNARLSSPDVQQQSSGSPVFLSAVLEEAGSVIRELCDFLEFLTSSLPEGMENPLTELGALTQQRTNVIGRTSVDSLDGGRGAFNIEFDTRLPHNIPSPDSPRSSLESGNEVLTVLLSQISSVAILRLALNWRESAATDTILSSDITGTLDSLPATAPGSAGTKIDNTLYLRMFNEEHRTSSFVREILDAVFFTYRQVTDIPLVSDRLLTFVGRSLSVEIIPALHQMLRRSLSRFLVLVGGGNGKRGGMVFTDPAEMSCNQRRTSSDPAIPWIPVEECFSSLWRNPNEVMSTLKLFNKQECLQLELEGAGDPSRIVGVLQDLQDQTEQAGRGGQLGMRRGCDSVSRSQTIADTVLKGVETYFSGFVCEPDTHNDILRSLRNVADEGLTATLAARPGSTISVGHCLNGLRTLLKNLSDLRNFQKPGGGERRTDVNDPLDCAIGFASTLYQLWVVQISQVIHHYMLASSLGIINNWDFSFGEEEFARMEKETGSIVPCEGSSVLVGFLAARYEAVHRQLLRPFFGRETGDDIFVQLIESYVAHMESILLGLDEQSPEESDGRGRSQQRISLWAASILENDCRRMVHFFAALSDSDVASKCQRLLEMLEFLNMQKLTDLDEAMFRASAPWHISKETIATLCLRKLEWEQETVNRYFERRSFAAATAKKGSAAGIET